MDESYSLTKSEKGLLEELVNISFGLSASLVEKMLQTPIELHVPKISVLDVHEVNNFLSTYTPFITPIYVTKQLFKGKVSGEIVFSISQEDAVSFTKLLHKITDEDIESKYVEGSLLELTNIMTSSCMGQLTQMLGESVHFVEPHIFLSDYKNMITLDESKTYTKLIMMKTILDLEGKSIRGDMYILTNPNSFSSLKELLHKMLG